MFIHVHVIWFLVKYLLDGRVDFFLIEYHNAQRLLSSDNAFSIIPRRSKWKESSFFQVQYHVAFVSCGEATSNNSNFNNSRTVYITTCSQLMAAKHEDASFSKRYGPPRIHATEHTLHTLCIELCSFQLGFVLFRSFLSVSAYYCFAVTLQICPWVFFQI